MCVLHASCNACASAVLMPVELRKDAVEHYALTSLSRLSMLLFLTMFWTVYAALLKPLSQLGAACSLMHLLGANHFHSPAKEYNMLWEAVNYITC